MALEAKKLSYFARGHKGKTEIVVTHYVSVTHHRVSFPSLVANTTRIGERLAHLERLSLRRVVIPRGREEIPLF